MTEEKTETTTKKSANKKTFIELVKESPYNKPIIVGALIDNQLYDKYLAEKENNKLGLPNEAQLTSTEFNKLIEKFLKKGV